MAIKVIAFEVDDTLWSGKLDARKFGKGPGASSNAEENLEFDGKRRIRDNSNHSNYITLFEDVPDIVHDISVRGIKLAIVSSNTSEALCNRALALFQAPDANNQLKPMISFVTYNELGKDGKTNAFTRIKEWSGASYHEIVYFDSDSLSKRVHYRPGVNFEHLSHSRGIQWDVYKRVVGHSSPGNGGNPGDPYDTPFYGKPHLGKPIGSGKYATVYESLDDSHSVIKVLKNWTKEMRLRFLEIYSVVRQGKPFHPGNNKGDQYILMVALELRNLAMIEMLNAPQPEDFTGWFTMSRIPGIPLWRTPLYKKNAFSVPFQRLIKTAFHLAVDEIEHVVQKYGIEHCDAHLANVFFTMHGDQPVQAHLLDWGISVQMTWDGTRYVRGHDYLMWQDAGPGEKYTPEEFRQYWIRWMVKTEYEALMSRHQITERDGKEFLKDIDWWYQR